mgnify:CR=1 FL=1
MGLGSGVNIFGTTIYKLYTFLVDGYITFMFFFTCLTSIFLLRHTGLSSEFKTIHDWDIKTNRNNFLKKQIYVEQLVNY